MQVITISLAIISFVISFRHFMQKGFLINNVYIYATKEDRETMNKSPYYKQSAVSFLIVGIIFLMLGLNINMYIINLVTLFLMVFAIASAIYISKKYFRQ
ncbi:MAG: hypothetical protein ATN36_00875 [Epulopiscium sp. Nele67-Bin005]|nr:MAG: hypothetical protein ATN36_00875 [Epulopiscium sp. Nele67-Bin005]